MASETIVYIAKRLSSETPRFVVVQVVVPLGGALSGARWRRSVAAGCRYAIASLRLAMRAYLMCDRSHGVPRSVLPVVSKKQTRRDTLEETRSKGLPSGS